MFVIPPQKEAKKVDVSSALLQLTLSSKGAEAAVQAKTSCDAFQRLRTGIHEPLGTAKAESGLRKYLCAVEYVQKHVAGTTALEVPLLWCNAFNVEDFVQSKDIALDRVSTAFNLAVCEALLGVEANKSESEDRCKIALQHFRNAASYFQLVTEMNSSEEYTFDLSNDVLKALSFAMLGNAQQMFYKHCCNAGTVKASMLALFAAGARDFYATAADLCRSPSVAGSEVDKVIGRSSAALKAAFNSEAQMLHGTGFHDEMDLGHAIPQYDVAIRATEEAMKVAEELETVAKYPWMVVLKEDLIGELKKRLMNLKFSKEEAMELNRTIYLCVLAADVPRLEGRKTMKVEDMRASIGLEIDDVFRLLGDLV